MSFTLYHHVYVGRDVYVLFDRGLTDGGDVEMSDHCEHSPGCPHWDNIVRNARRFTEMMLRAQRTNPPLPVEQGCEFRDH